MNQHLKNVKHECDFCVIGGGLAGMCAAIAAARHGCKVVLMHDRPLFGGNASGEVRMWVCGAHGENNRETGIIEEICLENLYRNPYRTWPIWDSVLYGAVMNEKNITALLNCSCNDCTTEGNEIKRIVGWQTTTQTYHTVEAKLFADCSGDSILAPLTGAEYVVGREARAQYDESIAPEVADKKTMGLTCLIEGRETSEKREYTAPEWAHKFTKEQLVHRFAGVNKDDENFWYMELGGTQDSIADTEEIRHDLIKMAYGMWDYVKHSGACQADNWELDFVGFLPGKRESRRYIGDYVMTQNDVRAGGQFEDIIAYGGWSMDDHHPAGIRTSEPPTVFHPAPSPYGIPYRTLYSKNINNLFFAGRNISVTHCAMSSTRVMATCALLGQAVGTAAAIAGKYDATPRGVYQHYIDELKQTLMEDGCYLPGNAMRPSEIMMDAKIVTDGTDGELLINGHERRIGADKNCWTGKVGSYIDIQFNKMEYAQQIRIVLDSDLDRKTIGTDFLAGKATLTNRPAGIKPVHIPKTLVKDIRVEILNARGDYEIIAEIRGNYQRIITVDIQKECFGVRVTPLASHGCKAVNIFSVNVK